MALVTLEAAKSHLRVTHDHEDEDIARKIDQASHAVLDYLKVDGDLYQDSDGEPEDVPPLVEAAVFIVLGNLYDKRDQDPLQGIDNLLRRSRDPSMS